MSKRINDACVLIPAVKERVVTKEKFDFSVVACFGNESACSFVASYLNTFLPNIAYFSSKEKANTFLIANEKLQIGAYNLYIQDKIIIEYSDEQGVRNALATLLQLIEVNGDKYFVYRQEIKDYPDCGFRSVMIDLARGLPDINRLKEDMRRLSLAKCNYIHLHLMDTMGVCYESSVLTMEEGIRGTKLYSKADLKELVAYCQKLGIELVPEFEIPAHAHYLTTHYKNLACKTQEKNPSDAVVCAGSEETYQFYSKLIAELAEIFPSKYLHMGGDELYFNDFPDWNYRPNWESCEVCKKLMDEKSLNGVEELYYYVVQRIYDIVNPQGKTLIIFNDQLNVSKPLRLPKDVIVQFWRVSDENRGPRKGCSYRKFLEQGYRVICSPYESCYVDLEEYANPEKIACFDFNDYQDTKEYKNLVLGGESCAWEYGNPAYKHYPLSFASSTILLLAKMWDGRKVTYDSEYRYALTRLILGQYVPNAYDAFELFGSIMPPRLNDKSSYLSYENSMMDDELIDKHRTALQSISYTYSNIYLQQLKDLIKKFK